MPSVLFVCLGNICRSPMAEAVAASVFAAHRRSDILVDSAGTSGWHVGEAPDPGTLAILRRHHQDRSMLSRRYDRDDAYRFDLVLAMDAQNLRDVRAQWPADATASLHLVLEPLGGGDVPDPYGDGLDAFDHVHNLLAQVMPHWCDHPSLAAKSPGTSTLT